MLTLPIAAEEMIPHRLPMRLVERLLEVNGKAGVVETQITADCPLVDESGLLEGVALIEMIAQGYAAIKGYVDQVDGKPVRQGFLVGIKKFERFVTVSVGNLLRIELKTLAELDDFAVAEGKIWCGTTLVGHGEIKIWIR